MGDYKINRFKEGEEEGYKKMWKGRLKIGDEEGYEFEEKV